MIENGSSLQLENQWLRDRSADAYGAYLLISAWNLLEKNMIWKMRSKKRIFLTKIFDTLCRFVHDDLMVGHPSAPVIPKPAISGVQSGWAATYLADLVPLVHYKGGEPYKMQIQFTKSKTTEFWLSRVLCAPNGMCILLQFVQDCALHL